MEEFKGMSRKGHRSTTPTAMWEFARNIILGKSYKSPSNEEGFDYKHPIPGKFIGKIETNEEVIYFSVDDSFSYIGMYKTNELAGTYIPIMKSIYLGFKPNRPIEGVFYYNYRKELVTIFSDGIFEDSNTPKLINLTNIGVELTPDLELVDPTDLSLLQFFAQSEEGLIDINYTESGTLEADIVYITYSYVLADGISSTVFFPVHEIAYPTHNFRELDRRNILLTITDLDSNYTQIYVGLVVITDEGLVGYQSPILTYNNGDNQVSLTLNNLANFDTISADEILVGKDVYSRIKTMTFVNDELTVANVVKEQEIKFQKFANNLRLQIAYDIRPEQQYTHPIYCPDEAYAHYISLQRLDGTYTEEFHIPGAIYRNINEFSPLTEIELSQLGLSGLDAAQNYKRFHIFNSGGFVTNTLASAGLPTFEDRLLNWGYWQNEELYPNNDEYNGTLDYNGNVIAGGEDLRNTPIRYHRVPGMDALVTKFPCLLGYNNKNTDRQLGLDDIPFQGLLPAFEVKVLNFDEVVPQYIKDQIQGYKLSIVKRKSGERLVEDINFIKQRKLIALEVVDQFRVFALPMYKPANISGNDNDFRHNYTQFGYSKVRSNTLHIYKPTITARIVKANYAVRDAPLANVTDNVAGFDELDAKKLDVLGNVGVPSGSKTTYGLIKDEQRFAVIDEVFYEPGDNIAAYTPFVEEGVVLQAKNSLAVDERGGEFECYWNPLLVTMVTDISATANIDFYNDETRTYVEQTMNNNDYWRYAVSSTFINLYKNLYSGFNPREFVTIGKTNLNNPAKPFKLGGDVFMNNIYNVPTTIDLRAGDAGTPNNGKNLIIYNQLYIKGLISIANNSEVYNPKDRLYGRNYFMDAEQIGLIIDLLYDLQIFNKEVFRSLNDKIVGIPFSIYNKFINYFPFRVARSLKVAGENLATNGVRSFLSNRYKEMLNDRGEVIAVRGTAKILYIQQKYTLMVASIKDKLGVDADTTYVGTGDLFDREPDEILDASNKGYIGCTSQFASIVFKDGYCVVDQVRGKIFVVGQKGGEITDDDMDLWFAENWDTSYPYFTYDRFGNQQNLDNPYTQIGHLIGYDDKYKRLLFTKKMYEFKYPEYLEEGTFTFDGEYYYDDTQEEPIKLDYDDATYFTETSKTLSFNTKYKQWVCEHDYFPNGYFYTNRGLFLVTNNGVLGTEVYKHNSKLNKGTYFGKRFESYIDLPFNNRLDLEKLYQNVNWSTQVEGEDKSNKYFNTIDAIMCYTDFHCTGVIDILSTEFNVARNNENKWNFNDLRDIVVDKGLPLIDNNGVINENNLNNTRSWFDKSNFIHTFIVVRMIMKNLTNNSVYIHGVNVKSRMSDRT